MNWDPEQVLEDFLKAAQLAGSGLHKDDITIEALPAPHRPPKRLPSNYMAVYVFSMGNDFLKVGKVGAKSQARYVSQHYNPRSANSTLAASMIKDAVQLGLSDASCADIGNWIKANTDRVNFMMKAEAGSSALTFLESFLQCRLKPRYEGFKSQR